MVKNLPVMQETQESSIQSLGQEDPLEKKMATHSSILAWEIPWTEEPDGPQSMRPQRVRQLSTAQHVLPLKNVDLGFPPYAPSLDLPPPSPRLTPLGCHRALG